MRLSLNELTLMKVEGFIIMRGVLDFVDSCMLYAASMC